MFMSTRQGMGLLFLSITALPRTHALVQKRNERRVLHFLRGALALRMTL